VRETLCELWKFLGKAVLTVLFVGNQPGALAISLGADGEAGWNCADYQDVAGEPGFCFVLN
jgi:hypothetical protein